MEFSLRLPDDGGDAGCCGAERAGADAGEDAAEDAEADKDAERSAPVPFEEDT